MSETLIDAKHALEACAVFVTPLEHLKGWTPHKEDAKNRIASTLASIKKLEEDAKTILNLHNS